MVESSSKETELGNETGNLRLTSETWYTIFFIFSIILKKLLKNLYTLLDKFLPTFCKPPKEFFFNFQFKYSSNRIILGS